MKIRIKLPRNTPSLFRAQEDMKEVDDILLWAMEMGLDAEFYSWHTDEKGFVSRKEWWAVFSINPDDFMLFILKWGAKTHKNKAKQVEET